MKQADKPKNLTLYEARSRGWHFDVDLSQGGSGLKGGMARGDKHIIDYITELVGTENAHIVVNKALHLNGALIASAQTDEQGNYTDKGKLQLIAGELITQNFHEYDSGHTLNAALNADMSYASSEKTGEQVDLEGSYKDMERKTPATIGKGEIRILKEGNHELNRDLRKIQREALKGENFRSGFFYDTAKSYLDIAAEFATNIGEALGITRHNAQDFTLGTGTEPEEGTFEDIEVVEQLSEAERQDEEIITGYTASLAPEGVGDTLEDILPRPAGGQCYSTLLAAAEYEGKRTELAGRLTQIAEAREEVSFLQAGVRQLGADIIAVENFIKGKASDVRSWAQEQAPMATGVTEIVARETLSLIADATAVAGIAARTDAELILGEKITRGLIDKVQSFNQGLQEDLTTEEYKVLEYSAALTGGKFLNELGKLVDGRLVKIYIRQTEISYKPFKVTPEVKLELSEALQSYDPSIISDVFKTKTGWDISHTALQKVPWVDLKFQKLADSTFAPNPRAGIAIQDSSKAKDAIRIMQGKPNGHPSQQQDYVKIVSNGKVIGREGRVILEAEAKEVGVKGPSFHPDAHIPLKEWLQWKEWNKK